MAMQGVKFWHVLVLSVCVLVMSMGSAKAEVRLPAIFSDHMVLQSRTPVTVWGRATPDSKVTVSFAGQEVKGNADAQGYWSVKLASLQPQATASEMTVREAGLGEPVVIHDVLVGEVWLACGQSNMAFTLLSMDGKDVYLEKAANDQIRFFQVKQNVAAEPLGLRPGITEGDVHGEWIISDAKNAAAFSAVGGLFAQELQAKLHRPVGMISSNWGGTPIQTWMSLDAFRSSPLLAPDLARYDELLAKHKQVSADSQAEARFRAEHEKWYEEIGKTFDDRMREWNKARETGGDPGPRPTPSKPEPHNPDPIGLTLGGERPHTPSTAFNAMIAPLIPFAAKGVLWYQGEENVSHWQQYGVQLSAMVPDWRTKWNEPNMEFLVVQLPAFGKNEEPRNLPHLREAQAEVLKLPHTSLIVSYDVGSPGNVHPRRKVDVAHRLTMAALGAVYGEHIPFRGPMLTSVKQKGDEVMLHFSDDASKLVIGQSPWLAPDAVQFPKDRLVGFEVSGPDGTFFPAEAEIHGWDIVLHAPSVKQPRSVRYAWNQSPQANLYDDAGLPAAPFCTDIPGK